LREVLPHTLVVQWLPADRTASGLPDPIPVGGRRGDLDIVVDFVRTSRGSPATGRELALLDAAVTAQRVTEASG